MDTKKKAALALALSGMMGSAVWSSASYACPMEPLISGVCIMAASTSYLGSTFGGSGGQYALADGRQLNISQYTALYALMGVTYGGDSVKVFNIPDLRGRVVVGSGTPKGMSTNYVQGQQGGSYGVTLTTEQMPNHFHSVLNAPVNIGGLTATTTLTGLTATANLGGVNVSGAASGLTLKASKTVGTLSDPTGNTLGAAPGAMGKIYTGDAPSVAMNSQSISGNLSLTIANGTTAPVAVSGTPSTTLGGTATVSANTTAAGGSSTGIKPVPTMMPYTVLNYYIALTGIFPERGN